MEGTDLAILTENPEILGAISPLSPRGGKADAADLKSAGQGGTKAKTNHDLGGDPEGSCDTGASTSEDDLRPLAPLSARRYRYAIVCKSRGVVHAFDSRHELAWQEGVRELGRIANVARFDHEDLCHLVTSGGGCFPAEKWFAVDSREGAPVAAGLYHLTNEGGRSLYIGEASNLRKRLRTHKLQFQSDGRAIWPRAGIAVTVRVFMVLNPESRFRLEYELIARHQPAFNIHGVSSPSRPAASPEGEVAR